MKNKIQKPNQLLILLTLGLSFVGCASVPDLIEKNKNASDGVPGDDGTDGSTTRQFPPGSTQSVAQEFHQAGTSLVYNKLDILFVVDTSGSLDDERVQIANGIQHFIEALPEAADFRIAVMLAHMKTSGFSGKLYQAGSEPLVLDSNELSNAQIEQYLGTKMRNPPDESGTDGGESGLFSLSKALDPERSSVIQAAGFFRSDAALAIAFVADENDVCSRYLTGINFVFDPDGQEIPAYNQYCVDSMGVPIVTHETVFNKLKAFKGTAPILSYGMIYTGENPIPSIGENEIGYGYKEFVNLAKGSFVDMADPLPDSNPYSPDPMRIAAGLSDLGDYTSTVLFNLQRDFVLEHAAIAESIHVTVDGVAAAHSYNSSTRNVHVNNAGVPNSVVRITYDYIVE